LRVDYEIDNCTTLIILSGTCSSLANFLGLFQKKSSRKYGIFQTSPPPGKNNCETPPRTNLLTMSPILRTKNNRGVYRKFIIFVKGLSRSLFIMQPMPDGSQVLTQL